MPLSLFPSSLLISLCLPFPHMSFFISLLLYLFQSPSNVLNIPTQPQSLPMAHPHISLPLSHFPSRVQSAKKKKKMKDSRKYPILFLLLLYISRKGMDNSLRGNCASPESDSPDCDIQLAVLISAKQKEWHSGYH